MFSSDKKGQEFLSQLATKLMASTQQLTQAARRLQIAELTYRQYLVRLRRLDEHVRSLISLLQGPEKQPPAPETNPAFCEPPHEEPPNENPRCAPMM